LECLRAEPGSDLEEDTGVLAKAGRARQRGSGCSLMKGTGVLTSAGMEADLTTEVTFGVRYMTIEVGTA
jgi:hypothetical protein